MGLPIRTHSSCPSRVFGIGLGKTGTTSLTTALQILGFDAIHAQCGTDIHTHQCATDTPAASRMSELLDQYPDAKFILTTRDLGQWLASIERHQRRSDLPMEGGGWKAEEYRQARIKLYGSVHFEAELYAERFRAHHMLVDLLFIDREHQLLRYPLTDGAGWGPLCEFLGVPVPRWGFPRVNANPQIRNIAPTPPAPSTATHPHP